MDSGSEFDTDENRYVQRLHRSASDRVVAGVSASTPVWSERTHLLLARGAHTPTSM
jgi:hypothetical protein